MLGRSRKTSDPRSRRPFAIIGPRQKHNTSKNNQRRRGADQKRRVRDNYSPAAEETHFPKITSRELITPTQKPFTDAPQERGLVSTRVRIEIEA
ncbi:unnamed protein product [Leptosia nina]|uniref:Uncharacterized protein n=1 Tax=Leptosia nina TaxID=320188 RepID=A0AAV1IZT0_9NEOP